MNLPNALTVIRILLIPLFLYKVINGEMVFATIVYLAAAITDGLDGFIARFWQMQTRLGTFLDPMADKLLITTSYVTLAIIRIIPPWLALAVVSRDVIIVTGSLLLYLMKHHFTVRLRPSGKITTFLQFTYVLMVLLHSAYGSGTISSKVLLYMSLLTGAMTVISGAGYILDGLRALED